MPTVKEEPHAPLFGEAIAKQAAAVSFAVPVQLATSTPTSGPLPTPAPMPSSSPGMPTSSPMDAVMSSPYRRASPLSSMCEAMDNCESTTEAALKMEQDSDEFCVSVNSLPQLIARIAADLTSQPSQPTTQPELDSIVETPEQQDVSMAERVDARVAPLLEPMNDIVDQLGSTSSQRCSSPRLADTTAPVQLAKNASLRQASSSRQPSLSRQSSASRKPSMSPRPSKCPSSGKTSLGPPSMIMGPPTLRRTADDVYDICEKMGQCRLVRNKRKVHRPFKVDQWKVSPVSK
ncbi:hypothetical protein CJU90_6333 [Yarrowia sp. C11]|nr:hypothetical protein CJU90_6333 [Yarrowia sp. C11]KAG5371037.1 hypothetical protein CKK34_1174 [Yarrowia sp. E02]